MRRDATMLLVVLSLLACDPGGECEDTDRDGFGPGCELGEDCDPDNADRNVDCVGVPPPDCTASPFATGCPCLVGGTTSCLDETAGVGMCVGGRALCTNGFWGLCDGGVGPTAEICDGIDQDCDGRVDETVSSPCGGCNDACRGGVWGPNPDPFEEGDGLVLTRFGELTLDTRETRYGTLWVSNALDGTVSRIDTESGVEVARYPSGGAEPSRVAVDFLGDAWVVNREFEGVSSVVRIASTPDRCVDRDGDGLETSDGPETVLADDECVVLRAEVGDVGELARAIAIDGDTGLDGVSGGDPWIGLHDGEAVIELDGVTGEVKTRVETPGFAPYAATFDRWGTLWMIERDGHLARIDTRAVPPAVEVIEVPYACFLLYGLAADEEGRLLMTGFGCDRIYRYEPGLERWGTLSSFGAPRAATFDQGQFWMAHTSGEASEVGIDPLRVRQSLSTAAALTPVETIGVALDPAGHVWTVSSRSTDSDRGVASQVEPETGAVVSQVEVGRGPHVQGDLIGNRVAIRSEPDGEQTHVFDGCPADGETEWIRVHLGGDPGGAGRIRLGARHAASRSALADQPFVELGVVPDAPAPWDLSVPSGGVLEVRLRLETDGPIGAPRVARVGVEWRCPGPD
ncbi:MAG: MopE-related protein [Sandaracinaceae bacterium]